MRAAVLIAVLVGAWWPSIARGDDRARAAEHFALAQSAEKRKDWRAAIAEYEEAYRLSPHPSVLYNIGLDYEHLTSWRQAARYFLRYLDEGPEAADRESVLARVRRLREKTSSVTIEVRPAGARVYLDGTQRGRAPIILALAGGRTYEVQAMDPQGGLSSPRRVTPEYGESFTLSIDLAAGEEAGEDPGPGNDAADSQIEGNAAGGPGGPPPGQPPVPETPPLGGPKLVSTGGAGYHTSDDGTRFTFGLGYRSPGNHVDVGLLTGKFGPMTGVGGELRLYFNAATVRPYVKVGWIYGWYEGESTAFAWEGGGGLLVATASDAPLGIDYYLEVIGHRRTVSEDPDLIDVMPEELDATSIAVVGGVGVRLGR